MEDCSKCRVDPSDPEFVAKIKDLHPDLREPLFLTEVTEEMFFKYIVLTYDVNSPYVIKYRDWAQRRRETAKLAEFPVEDGMYIKEAEEIILGKSKYTNGHMMRYLFLQNDTDFIRLQGYQAMLYSQMAAAMNPSSIKPAETEKLKKNIDSLTEDIKTLQKQIFQGAESRELLKALYDYAATISYDFRPEDVARKKERGEPIVDESPYPDSYKPQTMHFLDNE